MVMYICYNVHSPSAAMPKYGVCCLNSYMATNEACPNMGNGHSGRNCCSGQLGLHIWAYLQSDWCVDSCDIRAEYKLVMSEQTGVLRGEVPRVSQLQNATC